MKSLLSPCLFEFPDMNDKSTDKINFKKKIKQDQSKPNQWLPYPKQLIDQIDSWSFTYWILESLVEVVHAEYLTCGILHSIWDQEGQ